MIGLIRPWEKLPTENAKGQNEKGEATSLLSHETFGILVVNDKKIIDQIQTLALSLGKILSADEVLARLCEQEINTEGLSSGQALIVLAKLEIWFGLAKKSATAQMATIHRRKMYWPCDVSPELPAS